jgi:hypothetical protein
MRVIPFLLFAFVLLIGGNLPTRAGTNDVSAGLLFERFDLTLNPGTRTEVMGPLFYEQQKETEHTWAFPPLMSYSQDPAYEVEEFDFAYPVFTYDRYGKQYRWQLFQLLSGAGGPSQVETNRDRFDLFPIYFQQRSSDPTENYTALLPFYGTIKNRLFRRQIHFVMWPAYCQTIKGYQGDIVTDNYMVPFFHLRHGPGLKGWQLWPFVGSEHKDVTTVTNGFDEIETVPAHDKFFAVWPVYYNEHSNLGTTHPVWQMGVIPAFTKERSPKRDSTTVLWPFFTHITEREKKYDEWDAPWPFVEFARGEGKTTSRVWPFYSHARGPFLETGFFLWPIYKYEAIHSPPLERRRNRGLFFVYSDIQEKSTETGKMRRRTDVWPLWTWQHDFNGNTRLQIVAPLEVYTLGSHKIPRDYSPVWSVWRSEKNAKTGATSQSLLWNLYRREAAPDRKKVSALFGLFQYRAQAGGKQVRLFYIPFGKSKGTATEAASNQGAGKGGANEK